MMDKAHLADLKDTFRRNGVVFLPGFLGASELKDAETAYQWSLDNPGPGFSEFPGEPGACQDLSNPDAINAYLPMLQRSSLPALLSALWESEHVWFMYEQVFLKQRNAGRTPWHQDTPYMPIEGEHLAVVWMSFEDVPKDQALEYCIGSHIGPTYNGTSFKPGDPTDPLYKEGNLPRLPDIEAQRSDWNIASWSSSPGDVLIFHPSVLHGGGAPGAGRKRRTLSLRFFGDDAIYAARPGPTAAPRVSGLNEALQAGDSFRHPWFPELV